MNDMSSLSIATASRCRTRCGVLCRVTMLLLAMPVAVSAQDSRDTIRDELDRLHATLQADASNFEKSVACKRLAVIGTKESVPYLAPLLVDEALSHAARLGLESIPDPAAGAALRAAVPSLEGRLLIGVINSLGVRADDQATSLLCDQLTSSDPQVVAAAAAALGSIATPAAADALQRALQTAPPSGRAALGEACLTCAETAWRRGEGARAVELFRCVREAAVPAHQRLSATRGVILGQQPPDCDLLASHLRSESQDEFLLALGVAREIPGSDLTKILLGQLESLPTQRQVPVITLLGDRQDPAALPAVRKAAGSDQAPLRVAGLRALARLGNASNAPLLLSAATDTDASIAAAARDALVVMEDPELNAVILSEVGKAEGARQVCLLDLVGQRRISQALPDVIQAASSPVTQVRVAALGALGKIIPAEQLAVLTAVLETPTTSDDMDAARAALEAACVRLADSETCAAVLSQCLPKVSGDLRHFLLDLLGKVGGPTALDTVSKAAFDADEAIQDTATRVLGEWIGPEVAPVLLQVAQESKNDKFRVRALRGYIRVIRQFDVPDDERLAMCRRAMPLAQRNEERTLLTDALVRVGSPAALSIIIAQLDSPGMADVSGTAAIVLGESIVAVHPQEVADAMRRVLQTTQNAALKQRAERLLTLAQQTQTRS